MKALRPYQHEAVRECWHALKKDSNPVLLMASVGSGKSLMLANILMTMQSHGKRALCLVNNAELVRNNCETFKAQGGDASIYCASLNSKDCSSPVIFGTPQTILNAINKNESIAKIKFNMIIVDEAHAINYINDGSAFMRILRHFKNEYPEMRVLGATGTNFRFKGAAIVGESCLFKTQVGNITTEQLISENYLVKPTFQIDPSLVIDFSKVKIKSNGMFDSKQLEMVVSENARLTELICKQIIHVMESDGRFGAFIFATTKKHAYEILSHLPQNESAIILGETPQHERTQILDKARAGSIKYIVNISIISVGVDIPAFDTVAYLRPTESLVLLIQTLGRALRLSYSTNKADALILDFAGNIERHKDWDDPVLLDALKQTIDKDKPQVIICPECQQMNTESARRCVGVRQYPSEHDHTQTLKMRCKYYFEFKECINEKCEVPNDIAARHCRSCGHELIDPNDKLSLKKAINSLDELEVIDARYGITDTKTESFRVHCAYKCRDKHGKISSFYEHYTPSSDKAKHVFYGQFVKKHCTTPSDWYPHLTMRSKMEQMLKFARTPSKIMIENIPSGYKIKRKLFETDMPHVV